MSYERKTYYTNIPDWAAKQVEDYTDETTPIRFREGGHTRDSIGSILNKGRPRCGVDDVFEWIVHWRLAVWWFAKAKTGPIVIPFESTSSCNTLTSELLRYRTTTVLSQRSVQQH